MAPLSSVFGSESVYERLDEDPDHNQSQSDQRLDEEQNIGLSDHSNTAAVALETEGDEPRPNLLLETVDDTEAEADAPPESLLIESDHKLSDFKQDGPHDKKPPISSLDLPNPWKNMNSYVTSSFAKLRDPNQNPGEHHHKTHKVASSGTPNRISASERHKPLNQGRNNTQNNGQNGPRASVSAAKKSFPGLGGAGPAFLIDPKERALWRWSNVENMDIFVQEIYQYFIGNGIYCILLNRLVNMATLLFVVGFSTYLSSCIDYKKLPNSSRLSEVQRDRCMAHIGGLHKFLLWIFALMWFLKLFQYIRDVRRLVDLRDFYRYLLGISDSDMQTISWQHVVSRLVKLRDANMLAAGKTISGLDTKSRKLDAHSVANRIMRKENFMIGLINKDILDLRIPISVPYFQNSKAFYSRTLEWNIGLCIMDFVFNDQGQLRPIFLKESHKKVLSDGLRRRFMFAGIMNIICAPFITVYLALLYFFRYFNEYHKDPGSIGARQYSPYAEWKMREYNELYHLFQRRLNMSYIPASRYVNQFPKEKTAIISRFVAFVTGSFAAVLGIISLIDPEMFLSFEITKDRTVLFYIGIFGSILAIGRSMIPEETLVFDPETSMKYVIEFTHYMPKDWEGRLHSDHVKAEFCALYEMRLWLLLKELASVVISPFILWFSLAKCSDRIVDFFRENSVHVEGLGYVCSYAVFSNTKNTADIHGFNAPAGDDDKMMKSYLNFLDSYATNGPTVGGAGATGTGTSVGGGYRAPGHFGHNGNGNGSLRINSAGQVHGGPTTFTTTSNTHLSPVVSSTAHGFNSMYLAPTVEQDLENSVMGKFNKWQNRHVTNSPKLTSIGSIGSLARPVSGGSGSVSGPRTMYLNDDLDVELDEHQNTDSSPSELDNGGVLGLLNQFYKHTNDVRRM